MPVDFVVLDMHPDSRVSLILGRPFLSTANAHIDVGKGSIKFTINDQEEQFTVKPKQELNSSAKIIDQDKLEESPVTHSGIISGINNLEDLVRRTLNFEPSPEGNSVFTSTYFSVYIYIYFIALHYKILHPI